jgi:hypothetical protein
MEELPDIRKKGIDTLLGFTKAGLSIIPIAGPFIAEIIGNIIPNQRLERVTKYLETLKLKLDSLEGESIISQLNSNRNMLLLFEHTIKYSSETNSEDKYDYYSEFIIKALHDKTTEQIQKERVLNIISELNEIEIILLIYFSLRPTIGMKNTFIESKKDLLFPEPRTLNEPLESGYSYDFMQQYIENLERYKLLRRNIEVDRNTKNLKIDEISGDLKRSSPEITILGDLVVSFIGGDKIKSLTKAST